MQYDLFHTLTVDEHILYVVRNARRFAMQRFRQELPFCSQVMDRLSRPELLYLAAFWHDMAKGRGGDHSEIGADDAERFRSEEHTSELQSLMRISYAVFCLKKKNKTKCIPNKLSTL